jgi:hypothetical protein
MVSCMREVEIKLIGDALETYHAGLAALAESQATTHGPADAHLADLRHVAAVNRGHLDLVTGLVEALPRAEPRDPSNFRSDRVFRAEKPGQVEALEATVLWGPPLDRQWQEEEGRGSWPYFVIGCAAVESVRKRDPAGTELLLASAAPHPYGQDALLVTLPSWRAEVTALGAASEAALKQGLTTQEVDRLFEPATGMLLVDASRGFRTSQPGRMYGSRLADAAGSRVSGERLVMTDAAYVLPAGFATGISAEDMSRYGVLERAMRLAFIFRQTGVLRDALPAATMPDEGPTQLQTFVEAP